MVKTLLPANQVWERFLLQHLDKYPARTEQSRPTQLPTQSKPPKHDQMCTLSRRAPRPVPGAPGAQGRQERGPCRRNAGGPGTAPTNPTLLPVLLHRLSQMPCKQSRTCCLKRTVPSKHYVNSTKNLQSVLHTDACFLKLFQVTLDNVMTCYYTLGGAGR